MKTYTNFITERAGGPASPKGRRQALRAAAQNAHNRNKKGGNHQNNPAATPKDNVAGAAERLKKQAAERKAKQPPKAPSASGGGMRGGAIKSAARRATARTALERRKGGILGGVKSALGGDVIGMKRREGDSKTMDQERQKMKQKARTDFGKKAGEVAKKELRDVFRLPKQREVGVSTGGGLSGPKTRSSGGGAA